MTVQSYFVLSAYPYYSRHMKLLAATILTGLLLQFFVEPLLEGNPALFTFFCFFSGILSGMKKVASSQIVVH